MINLIKRLDRLFDHLFGKRSYLTNVKPCPCCGGRHILFEPLPSSDWAFFVCEDCGFKFGSYRAEQLIRDWEKLPRPKEDNHD